MKDQENKKHKYDTSVYEAALRDTYNVNYLDACLSRYVLPEEYLNKINAWVQNPSGIFYFAGNTGVGKTFFTVAFGKLLIEREKHFRCFTEKSLFSRLKILMSANSDTEWEIKHLCEVGYLLIDDIGSNDQFTDWQKDQLFSVIDQRSMSGFPTVITSNLFLADLKSRFNQRTISRLLDKRNLFLEVNWVDKRIEDFE